MQKKLYAFFGAVLMALTVLAAPPTTPASSVGFGSHDGGSMRVTWLNGNGARRIVVARMGTAVTANPVNGIDYLADKNFGLGQELSAGQFVVYDGTASLVDVDGLQPGTTYFFKVFEYNGTNAATEYLLTAPSGSSATLSAPVSPATNLVFSQVTGNSMRLSWDNGSGSRRLVLVREGGAVSANPSDLVSYSSNASMGAGATIGAGNYVVFSGTLNNVTVTNLQPNTTYHVAVIEANGSNTPVYQSVNPATGSQLTLPRPSVASSNLVFSNIEGAAMRLQWTAGNGSRRIVVARAGEPVDAVPQDGVDYLPGNTTSSPFHTAPEIAPGQKVIYDNNSTLLDLTGLAPATTYHFRIYEYDGAGATIAYQTALHASGSRSTVSAPTVPASAITFSNVLSTSMTLSWTAGDGARRIVVARAGGPVNALPQDLVQPSASGTFGNGTQLGSGNYVVYAGNANTATVTNLATNQTYHFAVFEQNGSSSPVFLTANPATGSQATSSRPTVAATGLSFSNLDGTSMRVQWTAGNGTRRILVVRENAPVDAVPQDGVDYLATTTSPFNTAPEIAPGQKVVYDNNSTLIDLSGLVTGVTYHFRVYEYSGTGTDIAYLTSSFAAGSQGTVVAPTTPASNITFSNVSGNSMTVSWINGGGARRIVVARAGQPVDALPVLYTQYSSNGAFGSGAQIGSGNFVVYANSSGNSITVTGLQLNTTYHFAVFEANGSNAPVYLTSNAPAGSQQTASRPTLAPGNPSFSMIEGNSMRLSFSTGDGERRIVVARVGAPVDAVPQDGVDYLASISAPFNSAPEIAPGQKVIYDNIGSFTDLTALQPGVTYFFRVYEYSGSGSQIAYLTSSFGQGSNATAGTPTLQASNINFTSVASTSAVVAWTNGNGANRMVVMRQGSPVSNDPADLTLYSPNTTFGTGNQVGTGNYVISRTNGASVTVTSLLPGTTYHVAIYEYNGSSAPIYLRPALTGQVTTIGPPSVQALNAHTGTIGRNAAQLTWTNGSGNRRIVLMKQGGEVDAVPANNVDYFANSFFGSGTQIGNGNYVVFDGIQDFVSVTNLQPGTVYHFAVFEYNDFGATSQVLTTTPARAFFATGVLPVTLTSFRAQAQPGAVELQWTTSQEVRSHYFEVQRSIDGNRFEAIGQVQAAGNSSATVRYSFRDAQPVSGAAYYRLKQVDLDGRSTLSGVLQVRSEGGGWIRSLVNPVDAELQLQLARPAPSGSQLLIYGMSGQLLKQQGLTGTQCRVAVSNLAPGTYVVEVRSGTEAERRVIVKR
jgi:hypothetical protein